jgi:hypothetical protein
VALVDRNEAERRHIAAACLVVDIGFVPPALIISNSAFCIYGLLMFFIRNSVNQLIFVMVKCGVLFEVRPEFLNLLDKLRLQRVKLKQR